MRQGERAFKLTQETPGSPKFEAVVSVSADGKTLAEDGVGGEIKRVWVFERQR